MFRLDYETPPAWADRVQDDLDALLSDHAHCEIQAATSAQAMIVRNPEHGELAGRMAELAIEEMEHFARVLRTIRARGGDLAPTAPNRYAETLIAESARTRKIRLLDRLVIAALIEARSLERFHLLATHVRDAEVAELYRSLIPSEASHRALFGRLARGIFDADVVESRERELRALEAGIVAALPFDHRVHSGVGE